MTVNMIDLVQLNVLKILSFQYVIDVFIEV